LSLAVVTFDLNFLSRYFQTPWTLQDSNL